MSKEAPINWKNYLEALNEAQIQSLASLRGWKVEWVEWLKEKGLIGSYNGNICLPIQVEGKEIDSIHVKMGEKWKYFGSTRTPQPLVIGPKDSKRWIVGESQWDVLTFFFSQVLSTYETLEEAGLSLVSTRGASNASRLRGVIPHNAEELILLTQNDEAGMNWEQEVAKLFPRLKVGRLQTPSPFKDFNAWYKSGTNPEEVVKALGSLSVVEALEERYQPIISLLSPSECQNYVSPKEMILLGDHHITRGEFFVIGGEPGVGKSRLGLSLAVAGARGESSWMGLPLYSKFKTVIIQTENGRMRLKGDFDGLDTSSLDEWIRISEPPPYGLTISDPKFQAELKSILTAFSPDVVILDPWNSVAKDDNQKEYLTALEDLIGCLPDRRPALGVVAHTRKPKGDEKRTGRGLIHLLAGSYVLSSRPRCVFILTHGSDDENGDVVIFHNPKNSNGQTASKTAWQRTSSGLFTPVLDFDWEEYEEPLTERKSLTKEHLIQCFSQGIQWLEKNELVKRLKEHSGCGKTAIYNAIKQAGKLFQFLKEENDGFRLIA